MHLCVSGDIDSIITSAKNMVKSAENVTTNVLDELLPIQEDVEKMKSTYGSTQSAGFSKALMEANNSGRCCICCCRCYPSPAKSLLREHGRFCRNFSHQKVRHLA